MYERVKAGTASGAGTVAILARRGWFHGMTYVGSGTAVTYDHPSAGTTAIAYVSAAANTTVGAMPPRPVFCNNGITCIVTTGGVATIYYEDAP